GSSRAAGPGVLGLPANPSPGCGIAYRVPRPAAEIREGVAGDPPLEVLSPFERRAFRVMRWANAGGGATLGLFWQRNILGPFFKLLIYRRLVVRGLDRLDRIPRDASVLLVANHRTFFDLFILGWILVSTWRRR